MLLSLRVADVIVAYAPGSIDAMMILALALHLDPVFVGAHHLARVFTVTLALPSIVRCSRRGTKSRRRMRRSAAAIALNCAHADCGEPSLRIKPPAGRVYSAASARFLSGRPSRSHTSTSASASASISASS